MARYLAVGAVRALGRRVGTGRPDAGAAPAVPRGERLVAVVNNGEWQSALDVTYAPAYEKLRRRCREGVWREMDLYLLDESQARRVEDGRRVLMNGLPVPDPGRAARDPASR